VLAAAPARLPIAAALIVVLATIARADDRKLYTLADLKALAKQQAWSELVDHLEDIPPASRDADWRDVAQQAGLGALTLAGHGGPGEGLSVSETLLDRYPVLKDSKDFMAKRATLGYAAFEQCFAKLKWAESCVAVLDRFVQTDPSNTDVAFRLAKLVPQQLHRWYAVPAFAVAIQKKDDARCKDPDVRVAVIAGLHLPADGHEDIVKPSIELASNTCWSALRDAVQDGMADTANDYLKNTCPFMKTRISFSPLLTKRCEAAANSH
jgi:hypothetical protein